MSNTICFITSSLIGYIVGRLVKSHYTKHNRPQYLKLSHNMYVSITILLSCIFAMFMDNNQDLLSLINYHCFTFCLVGSAYLYDLNFLLEMHSSDIIHHIVGWIGLCFMIIMEIGGGFIVRLLIDGFTTLIAQIQDYQDDNYNNNKFKIIPSNILNKLYWSFFIIIRIEWYNFICFQAFLQCDNNKNNQLIFKYFIVIWCLFANYYHYQLFLTGFWFNVTIKHWFKKHYFFTGLCIIIIPILSMMMIIYF